MISRDDYAIILSITKLKNFKLGEVKFKRIPPRGKRNIIAGSFRNVGTYVSEKQGNKDGNREVRFLRRPVLSFVEG